MSEHAGFVRHHGVLSSLRAGHGPRLVFVHGFTQTGRSWLPVASQFTNDYEVVLVDAPGHGQSGHADASLAAGADLLAETCGPATYVGYSMGGRLCLQLALTHPELVQSLVLIGATAGIEDDNERAQRRTADEALAFDIVRVGVEAFLRTWLALPLFASLSDEAAGLSDRLENTAEGLAASLRNAGTGTQSPMWHQLSAITAPTLVLAGASDAKFTELGKRLVASIGPNATFETIAGAGHSAHLEQPAAVSAAIRTALIGLLKTIGQPPT